MNGVIILDKPASFTSFDAVAVTRGLCHERKIGHTGTLDPIATGVLPLMLGQATGAIALLEDTGKEYEAGFALGAATDTQDNTGTVTESGGRLVSREELEAVLPAFRGEILQVPPMYSAVSVNGQRLYKLARQGMEIERPARPITIDKLELVSFDEAAQQGVLRIACSKGTYIRTLIDDLARAAQTLGCMTALRRTRACGFGQEEATPLEQLRELAASGEIASVVRPVEDLFRHCRRVNVTQPQVHRFINGNPLATARLSLDGWTAGERIRVYSPDGVFLGIGETDATLENLVFKKLFCRREEIENK